MNALIVLVSLVASAGEHRVLVMDLEAVGVPPTEASAATRVITAAAAEVDGLTIMSTADLRRLADLDANKYAVGCSDDASCVADLAGALGAEQVLFGSMSRLGSTTTVSLSLYSSATQSALRRSVDVKNLDELSSRLREKTRELLTGVAEEARADSAGSDDDVVVTDSGGGPNIGVITVGVGAAVGVIGAVAAGGSELLIQDPTGDGATKSTLQTVGIVGLAGVGVGVVVAATGVALMILGAE